MKKVTNRRVQYANRFELRDVSTGKVLGVYDLTEVPGTVAEEGTPLDEALFNSIDADIKDRVVKIVGKGLSTNDYNDIEKGKVAENSRDRHSHANKSVLDTYDQTNDNIKDAVGKRHSHANKSVLDSIEEAFTTALLNALNSNTQNRHNHVNKAILDKTTAVFTTEILRSINGNTSSKHSHENKPILDKTTAAFTTALLNALNSNTDARHSHSNKSTLDAITAAFTTALKTKLDGVANGATKTAVKGESENVYRTGNVNITKGNVGLGNVANERQYSASNPPPYPVTSVNGKTGEVSGLATKDEILTKTDLLNLIYPIGSIFITTNNTNTPEKLLGGKWIYISQGYYLAATNTTSGSPAPGTKTGAGLPNIKGSFSIKAYTGSVASNESMASGSFSKGATLHDVKVIESTSRPNQTGVGSIQFDASRSSGIYGNSNTVRPETYWVFMYQRIS